MIDPVAGKRVVILTGCSSGIGLQTALLFLKHEYKVFGLDINQFDNAHLEKLEGGRFTENFYCYQANLLEEGAAEKAVRACIEKFGQVDVLVNNAGIMDSFTSAHNFTDSEYDRVIGINLTAPLKLMRTVIPHFRSKKNGRIVNICSKASISGASAGLAYTVSKHGLLGATKHTAFRYKDEGITCNAVLPGSVGTNISNSIMANMDMESYMLCAPVHALNKIPGKKIAVGADEIARAVLFLASEGGGAISGVALPVDYAWSTI